jgi:hypothetical protein
MIDVHSEATQLPAGRIFAYGTCTDCPEQAEMAELLATHGLRVSTGRYNIRAIDCECFTFENEDFKFNRQWSLEGTAATSEVLMNDARRVSAVLTLAGVRHYIEICDAVRTSLEYLHHNWPRSGDALIASIATNRRP